MINLFNHVKFLFEQELYSDVVTLASIVIAVSDNNYSDFISPQETYELYHYYGDALFHSGDHRKAEVIYRKAIQLRKSMLKRTNKPNESYTQRDFATDIDIKYKMHICYMKMKLTQAAIEILQSIPAKQRPAKVRAALGRTWMCVGLERGASASLRDVLRECPLALEVADQLLKLGCKVEEIQSIIVEGIPNLDTQAGSLLSAFLTARSFLIKGGSSEAVSALRALEVGILRGHADTLGALTEAYYQAEEHSYAISTFQRARAIDPLITRGLDAYAGALAAEGRLSPVEASSVIPLNLTPADYSAQTWLAAAHCQLVRSRPLWAAYFAHKACTMVPRYVEALIVKGTTLLTLHKPAEAALHLRQAVELAPTRAAAHAGLAQALLQLRGQRAALAAAALACKHLNNSPKALTIYADVLSRETSTRARARAVLERALAAHEGYAPAARLLADLLAGDGKHQQAVQLLEQQLNVQSSWRLHAALAELLIKSGEEERAGRHRAAAKVLAPHAPCTAATATAQENPSTTSSNLHRLHADNWSPTQPPNASPPNSANNSMDQSGNSGAENTSGNAEVDDPYAPLMGEMVALENEIDAVLSDMDLEMIP